jgi:hypothetical protein
MAVIILMISMTSARAMNPVDCDVLLNEIEKIENILNSRDLATDDSDTFIIDVKETYNN